MSITPALRSLDLASLEARADDARQVLLVRRWAEGSHVLLAFNFSEKAQTVDAPPAAQGPWRSVLETGANLEGSRLTLPSHGFAIWSAT